MTKTAWSGMLVVTAMLAGQPVAAQSPAPEVTLRGALIGREPLDVSVDRSAYVTVFAVSTGVGGGTIQIVSPAAPGALEPLRGGQRYAARRLGATQVLALGGSGSTQLIAFASDVPPDYSRLATDGEWDPTLRLPDSLASDQQQVVRALASELYAHDQPYSVMVKFPHAESDGTLAHRLSSPNAGCEGFDAATLGSRRAQQVVLHGNTYGASRSRQNGSDPLAFTMPITSFASSSGNAPVRGDRSVAYIYDQRVQVSAQQMPGGPQCTIVQVRPIPEPVVKPGNRPVAAPASPSTVPQADR